MFGAIFVGIWSNIHVITLPFTDVQPFKAGRTNCKQTFCIWDSFLGKKGTNFSSFWPLKISKRPFGAIFLHKYFSHLPNYRILAKQALITSLLRKFLHRTMMERRITFMYGMCRIDYNCLDMGS